MKIKDTARCIHCEQSLGQPQKTVYEDGNPHTLYECSECGGRWYRPHR